VTGGVGKIRCGGRHIRPLAAEGMKSRSATLDCRRRSRERGAALSFVALLAYERPIRGDDEVLAQGCMGSPAPVINGDDDAEVLAISGVPEHNRFNVVANAQFSLRLSRMRLIQVQVTKLRPSHLAQLA
jgi:hypothetical protein